MRTLLLLYTCSLVAAGRHDVKTYGARGDGVAKDTAAVQAAVDAAAKAGGGTVVLSAGKYISGTIHLKSDVVFQIAAGATLVMSPDQADFAACEKLPYDTFSDRETSYFRYALLTGEDLENVTIRGEGTIEGNRAKRGGPKPIAFKKCRRVAVRDLEILNSPNYTISLLGCDYVDITGVNIRNGFSDGIDPDCSRYVRISNCYIESIDDAICLKTSLALGERRPTEHVTVTNCILHSLSINFKLGTESAGDFRNIALSNCAMYGRGTGRHGNPGVALETVDGGRIEGVTVSNITMQGVGIPFFLRLGARGRGQRTPTPGVLEDISFTNIVATGATRTCPIAGIPGAPVRRVTLSDIRLVFEGGLREPVKPEIPELPADYPDPTMFGGLPAYGIWARHAEDLVLRSVRISSRNPDPRPPVLFKDVQALDHQ